MALNAEQAQALGITIAAGLVWIGGWIGSRRSNGKPPDNRPPNQDEIRKLISGMVESQKRIERCFRDFEETDEDHKKELIREVYKMSAKLESLQRNNLIGWGEPSHRNRRHQNDDEN